MDTSFITLVSCHLIGLFYNMTQKDIVQWWGTSETYLWNVVTLQSFCDCDSFSNVLMLYINIFYFTTYSTYVIFKSNEVI